MSLFDVNVSIINKFCKNFKGNFSNTQFSAFAMFPYAMLKDYKRLNLSSLAKELPINYQTLQYFLADSRWNYESLNATRINLRLLIEHPVSKNKIWLRANELVKLVKKYLWHKTRMVNYNGKLVPVYALDVLVKDTQVKLKAFCILGKWSEEDDKDCHILITNNLTLEHKKACALYRLRWGIEQAFQEPKDSFYFDHYQID